MDLLTVALMVAFVASLLNDWAVINGTSDSVFAPLAFHEHGTLVLVVSWILGIASWMLLWLSSGWAYAIGGVVWFVSLSTLINEPILVALGLVPTRAERAMLHQRGNRIQPGKQGRSMGLFRKPFGGAAGAREAMLKSYQKHRALAEGGEVPVMDTPHIVGLFGALASRRQARGERVHEASVWMDLLPFTLMEPVIAVNALIDYVLYQENYDEADVDWLEKVLSEAIAKGVAEADEELLKWMRLADDECVTWVMLLNDDATSRMEAAIHGRSRL